MKSDYVTGKWQALNDIHVVKNNKLNNFKRRPWMTHKNRAK